MLYRAVRPFLFALDPEQAHWLALASLDRLHRLGLTCLAASRAPSLPVRAMGIEFPNPLGLAAGLDKSGEHIASLGALGFGFLEIGTVTPRPQPGNPKPRLFRLPEARALINRMGFNNDGLERVIGNIRGAGFRGVLGVNIGKNFDTPIERAVDDYVVCLQKAYPVASFITANISSPNTRDLRTLQQEGEIDALLATLMHERDALAGAQGRTVPLAIKVAPDLDEGAIETIADRVRAHRVDAVIATNTTTSREGVAHLAHAAEAGGLSGAPLRAKATAVIARLRRALGESVPIIGVGGIFTAADARAKLDAGANLVQIYTALLYRGPEVVSEIVRGLAGAR
ncbi:MAG: quinone-dependent dihydroorotate dehydrogenase [Betaproteobacteria bacterium]|nr:quinone-dependent dihydroorotate dehydrogenase [Betaproteobacteria bacterium]